MVIEDSTAIVVGGASGLGEATVRALHARGAKVTIADVNAEKGAELAGELGLEFVSCDVREEGQVEAAVAAAAAGGPLRIAVCCAGTGWAQKVASSKGPHPLLPFETIISINLIGTFNVLRYASAAMIADRSAGGRRTRGLRQHRVDRGLRRAGRTDRLLGLQGRRGRRSRCPPPATSPSTGSA